MKHKIIRIFAGLLLLVLTSLCVSYYTLEKVKYNYFISTVYYDLKVLMLLNTHRISTARAISAGGVNRIFVAAMEENDILKYSEFCDVLSEKNYFMLKKYDVNLSDNSKTRMFSKDYVEREVAFRKFREKFYTYCKSQRQ